MKKIEITDNQIKMIQNEAFDANFWFYQLGIGISEEDISSENRFSFDFYDLGREHWEKVKDQLMNILCDRDGKVPSNTMDELLNGDIRNIIVYILTILVANLDIVIGVAIPLVSLILKEGLKNFCLAS